MAIKTKVEFIEQSKCIVTQVHIESDTLDPKEVVELSKTTFLQAFEEAKTLNFHKLR